MDTLWQAFLAFWATTAGKKTVTGIATIVVGLLVRLIPSLTDWIGVVDQQSLATVIEAVGAFIAIVGKMDASRRAKSAPSAEEKK